MRHLQSIRRHRVLAVLIAAILLAGPTLTRAETAPLLLLTEHGEWPLGHHLDLLEDPAGALSLDQVRSPEIAARFHTSQVAVPNFGFTDSVYWARFRVKNASGDAGEWRLEMGFANVHRLSFYRPPAEADAGNDYEQVRTGLLEPFASRDVSAPRFVFRLPLAAGEAQTLYLRIDNAAATTLPLTLWGAESWREHFGLRLLIVGLFYGAMLVVLGHSLMLALLLPDRGYLWLVWVVLGVVLAQLSVDGLGSRYLWPQVGHIALYTVPLFTLLAVIAALRLSNTALDTRRQTPRLHRLSLLCQGLALLVLLQLPWFDYGVVIRQIAVLTLLSFVTLPLVAISAWRAGYRPARWFTLAWAVLTLTVLAHFLARLGYAPNNLLTENGYQFGMVVMAVLTSLGLTERIREMQRGRQQALAAVAGVQRASTLGEMAASIAHELNQPLAAISANAGALRRWLTRGKDADSDDCGPADKVMPVLEQLSADALRAGETLHRLRALFEHGQVAVAPLDINHLLREVVAMMQSEQRYARLQMTVDAAPALPPVAGDAVQIQQVLVNLISNAADAGASAIRLQTSMPRTDRVQVVVSDNGGGIGPAISAQIFEPFFSTRADGMGMGLAICSTIISGHDGKLWSEPGTAGGSRLLFTLPIAGADPVPAQPVPDQPMPDQQDHRRDGRPAVPDHTATPPRSFP